MNPDILSECHLPAEILRLAEQAQRGVEAEVIYPNENYTCGICGYGEMCEK